MHLWPGLTIPHPLLRSCQALKTVIRGCRYSMNISAIGKFDDLLRSACADGTDTCVRGDEWFVHAPHVTSRYAIRWGDQPGSLCL